MVPITRVWRRPATLLGVGMATMMGVGQAAIDPAAEQVLRSAGAYLAGADSFRFQADVSVDEKHDSGLWLEYSLHYRIAVQRPDRLRATVTRPGETTEIWYDGETFTVLAPDRGVFVQLPVTGSLDGALDTAMAQSGHAVPLARLLYEESLLPLLNMAEDGFLVGTDLVAGTAAWHLAFRGEDRNWQLWVDDGAVPLLLKGIITYTGEEDEHRYRVEFSDWDLATPLAPGAFEFVAPAGAQSLEEAMIVDEEEAQGQ